MPAETYVKTDDYREVETKLRAAEDRVRVLVRQVDEIKVKAYQAGREDERAELTKSGAVSRSYAVRADESKGEEQTDLAYLRLPDNGGTIQLHIVGPSGPPHPESDYRGGHVGSISLRVWGPPDERASFGVHEQGGGNLTDMDAVFDLTDDGIVMHQLKINERF